jgi:hypothetical protein
MGGLVELSGKRFSGRRRLSHDERMVACGVQSQLVEGEFTLHMKEAYFCRFVAENKDRDSLFDFSDANFKRSFEGCVAPLKAKFYGEFRWFLRRRLAMEGFC